MSQDIRNLGTYANIAALWEAHPEGGREGDYATVSGTRYRWNKYDRIWENGATVTQTTATRNHLVEGDQEVTGDMTVLGTLRAKHVKQPHMGMYESAAALQAALPTPEKGWYALVGNTLPAELYVCNTAGIWTDTGNEYEGEDVDLTQYVKTSFFQDYANRGYKILGDAVPDTVPSSPSKGDAYLASTAGTYVGFGDVTLEDGQMAMFKYNGSSWSASLLQVGKNYGAQISQLEHKVSEKTGDEITPVLNIEQGGISTAAGQNTTSNTRIRTNGYIIAEAIRINPGTGKAYVMAYKQDNTYISADGWLTEEKDVRINGAYKYRITFAYTNDGNITPADFSSLSATVKALFYPDFPTIEENESGYSSIGNHFSLSGRAIKKTTGASFNSTDYCATGYLPINKYGNIRIAGYDGGSSYDYSICAFFDSSKSFISAFSNSANGFQIVTIKPEDIPANAVYIRCTTQKAKLNLSYVLCNITEQQIGQMDALAQTVGDYSANINKLLLSQYGILQSESASNTAGGRVQKKVGVSEGRVRFRATIISGTPAYTNYVLWLADGNSDISKAIAYNLDFGKVYEVDVPSGYTGITVRTGTSTPVGTVQIDILGNSDEYTISQLQGYQETKMVNQFSFSPSSNGRMSKFIECSGALRIKVSVGWGTPSGSYYRVYFGTSGSPTDRCAIGNTPYGETVDVYLSPDFGYTGINLFTVTADSGQVRYDVTIEQIDTAEEKARHRERILCIGDSITQFNGQNNAGTGVNRSGMRYSDFMYILRPGQPITNIGIGGTRIARRTALKETPTTENEAYAALDMVSLVNAVCGGDFSYQDAAVAYINEPGKTEAIARAKLVDITKIDIVTILGGTNDWANDQTLGTVDDTSETTTLGALNTIISTLLTANPRLKIYVMLPPVRYKGANYTNPYWCDVYQNANGQTLLDLCESLESVAAKNYMPTVDLHRDLGWNKQNFWSFFIAGDGTHPIAGFKEIAEKVMKSIF